MKLPKNCRAVKVRFRFPKSFSLLVPDWVEDKGQESAEVREVRMSRHSANPGELVCEFSRGVAVGSHIVDELDELGFVCVNISIERRTDVQVVDEVPEYNKKRVVEIDSGADRVVIAGLTLNIPRKIITLESDYRVVKFDFVPEGRLITGGEVREYFNLLAETGWGRIRVFENPVTVDGVPNGNNTLSISFDATTGKPKKENNPYDQELGWGLSQLMHKRDVGEFDVRPYSTDAWSKPPAGMPSGGSGEPFEVMIHTDPRKIFEGFEG